MMASRAALGASCVAACRALDAPRCDGCPVRSKKAEPPAAAAPPGDGCPVRGGGGGGAAAALAGAYRAPVEYNAYGEPIDPRNRMPSTANQQPAPGQTQPLSTERVSSSIPKAGADGADATWSYPSPQMFWNALVRKGKAAGSTEADMDTVIAIHNNMNELTWMQVLAWEALHPPPPGSARARLPPDAAEPKLLNFIGRPHELSARARMRQALGAAKPFDRHDWVVDRAGQRVRYIIDYYHDGSKAEVDNVPALREKGAVRSIAIDVRPALDSVEALLDRWVTMPLAQARGDAAVADYEPLSLVPSADECRAAAEEAAEEAAEAAAKAQADAAAAAVAEDAAAAGAEGGALSPDQVRALTKRVQAECHGCLAATRDCVGDEQCSAAAVRLQHCLAGVLCPREASAFKDAANAARAAGTDDARGVDAAQAAYDRMEKCLNGFQQQRARVTAQSPK